MEEWRRAEGSTSSERGGSSEVVGERAISGEGIRAEGGSALCTLCPVSGRSSAKGSAPLTSTKPWTKPREDSATPNAGTPLGKSAARHLMSPALACPSTTCAFRDHYSPECIMGLTASRICFYPKSVPTPLARAACHHPPKRSRQQRNPQHPQRQHQRRRHPAQSSRCWMTARQPTVMSVGE